MTDPSRGFVRSQRAPVLNGCPHLTRGAISDSFVNHKLKSSLPETAIVVHEMTMKSLFLWQFTKAAFVKVVCLWAALLLHNRHQAGWARVSAVTSVDTSLLKRNTADRRLGGRSYNRVRCGPDTHHLSILLPVQPLSPSTVNSTSPTVTVEPLLHTLSPKASC